MRASRPACCSPARSDRGGGTGALTVLHRGSGQGTIVSGVATCDLCGCTPAEPLGDEVPLTWVTSVENGRARTYCDACARENLRAIESKLDPEWW